MGALQGFRTANLRCHLPEPTWSTNEVYGYINRLSWIQTRKGSRILASTCGSAAQPRCNGIYLLTATGELESTYPLSSTSIVGPGDRTPAGVRDVRSANVSSPEISTLLPSRMIHVCTCGIPANTNAALSRGCNSCARARAGFGITRGWFGPSQAPAAQPRSQSASSSTTFDNDATCFRRH